MIPQAERSQPQVPVTGALSPAVTRDALIGALRGLAQGSRMGIRHPHETAMELDNLASLLELAQREDAAL